MIQKRILLKSFCGIFAGVLLLSGCGKDKEENSKGLGSSYFGDYAVAVSEKEVIYTDNADQFEKETMSLPVETNYLTIYDNKLYYTSADVGYETGEVEGGSCTILCSGLDGKNPEKVLELSDVSYLDSFIQEGILYCVWETSNGEAKEAIVELSSGNIKEIEISKAIRAVNGTGYYFEENNQIYYSSYGSSEKKLFCEPKGEVISLYFNNKNLCVLNQVGDTTNLSIYNEEGTCISEYEKLETVDEFQGRFISMVKAEENILYYELSGDNKSEKVSGNCSLIRFNLENGIKEVCGIWYMP